MIPYFDCGGCAGLGSHRRWCVEAVGPQAHRLAGLSEQAEAMADWVGSNCFEAANALYRAASLLATEAGAAADRWRARRD